MMPAHGAVLRGGSFRSGGCFEAGRAVLEAVRDPGENPPPGSLLVANHGDGTYVYTALGWYRQLRVLHAGTVRIFANMLAL